MANTLESLLADILRREKDSLQIIEMLSSIYSANNDRVTLIYQNPDGTESTYQVESHSYLMSELKRIDKNLTNITGMGTNSASIKLPDGTIKTIFSSEAPVSPAPVGNIAKPMFFYKRGNKVYDTLLDPLIYVKFDLTNYLNQSVKQVLVKKAIINADTVQTIDAFNQKLNNTTTSYDAMVALLNDEGITWDEYDEVYDLPPKNPRFSGSFDVVNIVKKDITQTLNGQQVKSGKMFYKLNTILYTDIDLGKSDVSLKIGDQLYVTGYSTIDTSYKIETIDTTTNEITVKTVEGYRNIVAGVNRLEIAPGTNLATNLEVRVSNNEYAVIFFKPLNPNMNIVNTDWGTGIGMYTGELVDYSNKADTVTLNSFYDMFVKDPGANLKSLANDKSISLQDAIKPDAPVLYSTNFRVEQINKHREDQQSSDALRKSFSDKNTIKSKIDAIDVSIDNKKVYIAVTKFNSDTEMANATKDLSAMISTRESLVKQYNTLINDIIAKVKNLSDFTPKYAALGFFGLPLPKYKDPDNKTGQQDAIQFIIQYRYLRKDNTSVESPAFIYKQPTDTSSTTSTEDKKATFSRWEQIISKMRDKSVVVTNTVAPTSSDQNKTMAVTTIAMIQEDTINPDEINANQIKIDITSNESIEIRVKSVSEAGYPFMQSDWSNSIIIDFPDELINAVDVIGAEAQNEQVKAMFMQELNAMGVDNHLSDNVDDGAVTYKHLASSIATTFKTPENKPIDVNSMIVQQQSDIANIKALMGAAQPKMQVNLLDSNGNFIQKIENNDSLNIFAGYYKDQVSGLANPKGAIISKVYFIEVANVGDIDLELLSYVPGGNNWKVPPGLPESSTPYSRYLTNQDEYMNYRKYWQVPLSFRSYKDYDTEVITNQQSYNRPYINSAPFQSSQMMGQIVYGRERDITLNDDLYATVTNVSNKVVDFGGTPTSWIWAGHSDGLGYGGMSTFGVHINHPDLILSPVPSDFMNNFSVMFNRSTGVPHKNVDLVTYKPIYPNFCHSPLMYAGEGDTVDYEKQQKYLQKTQAQSAVAADFPIKMGFLANDQYLIGKYTCGAYAFIGPPTDLSLFSGSLIYNKGLVLKYGASNSIRIPIIFTCRMTDYYGSGDTGTGLIGGYRGGTPLSNITYAKKIGIDLLPKGLDIFSVDLRFEMQYKAKSVNDIK